MHDATILVVVGFDAFLEIYSSPHSSFFVDTAGTTVQEMPQVARRGSHRYRQGSLTVKGDETISRLAR